MYTCCRAILNPVVCPIMVIKLTYLDFTKTVPNSLPLTQRKRYGTYLDTVNDTCLKQECVNDTGTYNIWAREKILVKKIPENEVKSFKRKTELNESNVTDTREDLEVLLTPPIITVWQYELAFALSEGFDCFK